MVMLMVLFPKFVVDGGGGGGVVFKHNYIFTVSVSVSCYFCLSLSIFV